MLKVQKMLQALVFYLILSFIMHTQSLINDFQIMINGLPGPMAYEAAVSCLNRGFEIVPIGFTGKTHNNANVRIQGSSQSESIELVSGPGLNPDATSILKNLKLLYPNLIIVDYTHPSATLSNVQCYVDCQCDFVMGTTGGDPEKLRDILSVSENKVTAVIAPNMGKQIVALQAALQDMAARFPGSFDGYKLEVVESHQSSKADTSGTAKAVVSSLSKLNGKEYPIEDIRKLRDKDSQLSFGVPEDSLNGHAFHTYKFTSLDGTVSFELKHNVVGRKVYAEGTADAVSFVNQMRAQPSGRRLYNMIDVLEAGKLI